MMEYLDYHYEWQSDEACVRLQVRQGEDKGER